MAAKLTLILMMALLLAGAATADELAVTVYNSNLGVVSETRKLEFEQGVNRLAFRDVPAMIDASSVRFEVVGRGHNVSILEQNYAYDLVSPEQMYDKYIDQRIELIDKEGRLYAGELLAYSSGAVTLRDDSGRVKIVSLANIAEVNFPLLPEGLITRPTLFWLYRSDFSGSLDGQIGYQTGGLNWSAEYVGLLDEAETGLDLSGWASINNVSGKTYRDAKLKLIAGDIQRVAAKRARPPSIEMAAMADARGAGFEEKAFFEYHMYTLPRAATLANKEIKQISLFDPASTKVKKVFLYQPDYDSRHVKVKVEFTNSSSTGLGMPLPAGRVRLFKADSDGSLVLLGEDRIGHTPKDEKVTLTVGSAFDIAAEEKLVQQVRISDKVEERQWEIELRNRKTEDVTVKVEKRLWGFWEVLDANYTHEQKDANTLVFSVPVKAGEVATIKFTVRITR